MGIEINRSTYNDGDLCDDVGDYDDDNDVKYICDNHHHNDKKLCCWIVGLKRSPNQSEGHTIPDYTDNTLNYTEKSTDNIPHNKDKTTLYR